MRTLYQLLPLLLTPGFAPVKNKPVPYEVVKSRILAKQCLIRENYMATDSLGKDSILGVLESQLPEMIVNDIIPYWYNTPWEFYGTTEVPGQGTIACGYFVTTVLRDAGFIIPRVNWAKLPSETMIRKLNSKVKRFVNADMKTINSYFKEAKNGLYLSGLDHHIGFVLKKDDDVSFIHSSYYQPETGVMSEPINGKNPLNDSKYRVFARIFHKDMCRNWVLGIAYK